MKEYLFNKIIDVTRFVFIATKTKEKFVCGTSATYWLITIQFQSILLGKKKEEKIEKSSRDNRFIFLFFFFWGLFSILINIANATDEAHILPSGYDQTNKSKNAER